MRADGNGTTCFNLSYTAGATEVQRWRPLHASKELPDEWGEAKIAGTQDALNRGASRTDRADPRRKLGEKRPTSVSSIHAQIIS
ncbi:hypothetical protein ACEQPO_28630 [Bacillus sp. SL00103]